MATLIHPGDRDKVKQELINKLKDLREESKMSYRDLAKVANTRPETLSAMEKYKYQISYDYLFDIFKSFGQAVYIDIDGARYKVNDT